MTTAIRASETPDGLPAAKLLGSRLQVPTDLVVICGSGDPTVRARPIVAITASGWALI
jgi:hypothetical protein